MHYWKDNQYFAMLTTLANLLSQNHPPKTDTFSKYIADRKLIA